MSAAPPPAAAAPVTATPPALLEPFRGIDSYRYADQSIFFGRDEEAEELNSMIRRYRGVLLYGISGCGKSSLINARLTPELSARGWVVERLRVQAKEGQEIVLKRDSGDGRLLPSLIAKTNQENEAFSAAELLERIRKLDPANLSARPLLIIDQFEELVTLFDLAPTSRESRILALKLQAGLLNAFFSLLRESLELPVKLLFAFREDYLAKLRVLTERCPELQQQSVRLEPLLPEMLPEVITGPFRSGITFGRVAFPDTLVKKLTHFFNEASRGGPVKLTELQIVCLSLYRADQPEKLLDMRGIKGVMEDYLEKALTSEPPEIRRAATTLLTRLLTPAETRNVVSRDDLIEQAVESRVPKAVVEAALACLTDKLKLVREELRGDTRLCEIVSEFLVPWIRKQRAKRKEEEEQAKKYTIFTIGALVIAVLLGAFQWQRSKTEEIQTQKLQLEVQGSKLAEQAIYIERLSADQKLGSQENARTIAALSSENQSLRAGLKELQDKLQQNGKQLQEETSRQIETLAVQNESLREGLTRVREALVSTQTDIAETAQMAVQGLVEKSEDSKSALLAVLGGHTEGVKQAVFSSDGQWIATAGADKRVVVWGVNGEKKTLANGKPFDLPGTMDQKGLNTVAFSPDGKFVFAGGFDASVSMLSTETGISRKLAAHQGTIMRVIFSPDGRLGATVSADGTAKLWGPNPTQGWLTPVLLNSFVLPRAADATQKVVTTAAFSPDSSRFTAGGDGHFVGVWQTKIPFNPIASFPGGNPSLCKAPVRRLVFSQDGKTVAAGAGTKVLVWREGSEMLRLLDKGNAIGDEHIGAVWQVAFCPADSEVLASIGADGRCILWDVRDVRDVSSPKAIGSVATQIRGRLFALEWQRQFLALGGEDGWLEIWDMSTPATPKKRFSTAAHSGPIWGIAFSPDRKILMTYSGMLREKQELPSPKGEAAHWSGNLNLTPDGNVMLWNLDNAKGWQEKAAHSSAN